MKHLRVFHVMPKNRKLQNIIGTEHITDAAETAIAAQASGGATVAFKNVGVSGQDTVVADAATDTLNIAAGANVTITTNASTDTVTIAATDTNTQLSNEQVQDIVGAMFTGNTETNITATYQDSDGTIDLVASGGGGGSGYMQAVTNWPNFSTNALIFVPSSNPPLTFDVLTVSTKTLSDDIQFTPWLFRQDTTISEIGFRLSGTGNPVEMCVYESNSDGFPTNKVANSTATFASPSSGNNMATMAAGSGGITFSANELYWCAITNTTTGANVTLTTHGNAGSVVGMPGGIYNRSTLQLVSGTVNALPSSIGTLSISASYQAFMAFAKKA